MIELGFWKKLRMEKRASGQSGRPIVVMAPMADVTDAAYRRIIAKYSRMGEVGGGPDAMWTEFVSADGLMSPGRAILLNDLRYTDGERPIVAQIFSANPDKMRDTARLLVELGFDGIDINMGCPDRSVEKQGSGAAHMRDYARAREVIRAVKEGAPHLPVSVKTRVGYNKVELDAWVPELLAEGIALLTIHARTRKEMSDVPARWEHVRGAVVMRDRLQADIPPEDRTLIFGNGDVMSLSEADDRALETGADGVMIGRGIFGRPWFFDRDHVHAGFSLAERLNIMVEHTKLFEELMTGVKNFAVMKKHFKAYVSGWDGAKDLRVRLMETENSAQVEEIIKNYLSTIVN